MNTKILSIDEIKYVIMNRITTRLKLIFGKDYDHFITAFKKSNSMLSGSFILQCCYNEKYEYSDIDIYTNCNNDNYDFLKTYDYFHTCRKGGEGLQYFATKTPINSVSFCMTKNEIDVKRKRINIIELDESVNNIIFDVMPTFDFTIIMNAYWIDENNVSHLHLQNINNIIHKTTKINEENNNRNLYKRYYKYKQRGITFECDEIKLKEILDKSYALCPSR